MTKTYLEKPADVKRKWFLVDADGKTLAVAWPRKWRLCYAASTNPPSRPTLIPVIMS